MNSSMATFYWIDNGICVGFQDFYINEKFSYLAEVADHAKQSNRKFSYQLYYTNRNAIS